MKSKAGAQINHSILDGIAVLQAIAGAPAPIGGKEIAERLGLENTRVNRLLKTLASVGIAQQTTNRKYTPGPGIHVLATQSLYASGLLRSAIPSLEKLTQLNLTVAMGVLWFDTVSYVFHAKPGMSAAEGIGRVGLRPATMSGIGMALLANSPIESVIEVYKDKTIPNFPDGVDSLLAELEKIRQQGWTRFQFQPDGEVTPNKAYTVSLTVGQPANSAIALQGDISEDDTQTVLTALREAKQAIEIELAKIKSLT
ncbi:transcriptional regulator [Saccharobesus litoralis]|uniref:Transcriptional regulator n=1 Tax=Saccharobesus litoralis TaxID=2172099 RepID=A0A2S0VMH8_9ALTE|nr:helix-turn-helix domain-containing protein [Saccharobesus litoralis]AWB65379.1 transcriptional regulator [Saccharobesus litoralis]